jgi:hypothetical protein
MLESFIISLAPDILSNGLHDLGEVRNECYIIASKSKETLYLEDHHWQFPFQDLLHFAGVHRESFK